MNIRRVGEKYSKVLQIDIHLKLPTPTFNKMCNVWGIRPTTTDEFYSAYLREDTKSILKLPCVCRHAAQIDSWASGYTEKLKANRIIEINNKKEHSANMTELAVHVSKEDEYFRTALGGILANPTTPFSMIDPKIIIAKADEIAKACMERTEKQK